MRYAFNSFSMPEADLAQLLATAAKLGYDGIELRLSQGHRHGVEVSIDADARSEINRQIEDSGIAVPCLCTSVRLAVPTSTSAEADACRSAIDLAADIGTPLVRVFGGPVPDDVSRVEATETLLRALSDVAAYAEPCGVTVVLETHDDWAEPRRLADVMTRVGRPGAGILWDVWHTGRAGRASVSDAYAAIKPWVRHVQMHDGLLRQDVLAWRSIGLGEVDHLELLACLIGGGYDGMVAGEWIDWQPAAEHLPRELATMRRYEALLGKLSI